MQARTGGGGRREIAVTCPNCNNPSSVPPSAVVRNSFFCSGCGKPLDLSGVFRQFAQGEAVVARRERDSKYKSARKARR